MSRLKGFFGQLISSWLCIYTRCSYLKENGVLRMSYLFCTVALASYLSFRYVPSLPYMASVCSMENTGSARKTFTHSYLPYIEPYNTHCVCHEHLH